MSKLMTSSQTLAYGLWIISLPLIAAPASDVSFSAQVTSMGTSPDGGSMTMTGKLWVSHGMIRRESLDEGHVMVVLNDPAHKKSLHLVPDQGFYEDVSALSGTRGGFYTDDLIPGGPADVLVHDLKNPCANEPGVHCKRIGPDSVNGRPCEKWRLASAAGKPWTECIDQGLGAIIEQDRNGRLFTLTEIREGPQEASLFLLPTDMKLVVLQPNSYQMDYETLHPETPK
jgi:hypothetical protein